MRARVCCIRRQISVVHGFAGEFDLGVGLLSRQPSCADCRAAVCTSCCPIASFTHCVNVKSCSGQDRPYLSGILSVSFRTKK